MSEDYRAFLEGKVVVSARTGFDVDLAEISPALKPHQRAIVQWALRGGCRAIFAAFGLGKTLMQIEIARLVGVRAARPALIVIPLGVRQEFRRDAEMLGLSPRFVRRTSEIDDDRALYLTNYESVRDGKLDPNICAAASLDEASVLRSYGSKTFQEFLPLFEAVRYKFVATATPSPNRYKELIHYAGFLGVMDTGQALTRFFQRDSEAAGNLNLYPHKEDEFWLWVHSWALFIQRPSDLGFSDAGYDLPPLTVTYHEVPSDHSGAGADRDGQGLLLRNTALGVTQAAAEKRDSLPARIGKVREILAADPDAHAILWHDLEAERHALEKAVPAAVSVYGTLDLDERERRIVSFSNGGFKYLSTKPEISGSGCNFQRHCAKAVFVGIGFKFNDFIQSIHRIYRFLQERPCEIHVIYSEAEREVLRTLQAKWARHDEMTARMSEIIRTYGLDRLPVADVLQRSIGVERREAADDLYCIVNNDCVAETESMPDNSVDLVVTSIPFANHYEYTDKYNDFGHTDDNAHFWRQMDFLSPQLLRVLRPGRLACIHVKDRILFGNVTGAGVPTVSPFHAEAIFHGIRHGFDYLGMITVVTDVVRENNQTYRLGWSENAKDSSKMGVGSPEYVLLFRKPQSDRGRGYADVPVRKAMPLGRRADGSVIRWESKAKTESLSPVPGTGYSRSRWQVDAHAFWRSSGDRLLTVDELARLGPDALARVYSEQSLAAVYDHEAHVRIGEELDGRGALPSTFMALAPGSAHPEVWHDVVRMLTMNSLQVRRGAEKHVCPLQFDIVDRLIRRFSNEGETVLDPFGGLMTVPYRAVLLGRKGIGIELKPEYFDDGEFYLRQAAEKRALPSLFDLIGAEEAEAAE